MDLKLTCPSLLEEEESTTDLLPQSTTIPTLLPCPTSPTQRSRNTGRGNRRCSTFPIDQDQVNHLQEEPSLQVLPFLSTTEDLLLPPVQDSTLIDPPPPIHPNPPTLPSLEEVRNPTPTPTPNPNLRTTSINATSINSTDPSNLCSSPQPLPSDSIELQY